MHRPAIFGSVLFLCSFSALAQTPSITVDKLDCVPTERNGLINANVRQEVGGTTTRVYFRWDQHGAFYYVDMFGEGAGRYWGIPAKPEDRNEQIEAYVAVVDGAGRTIGRSETVFAPVREDCRVEMTPRQIGVSNNLVVGETVAAQQGRKVLGFLCDGVVTRVNFEGIMRPDEICRGCVVPFFTKETFLAPIAIGVVVPILPPPPEESSTSRP